MTQINSLYSENILVLLLGAFLKFRFYIIYVFSVHLINIDLTSSYIFLNSVIKKSRLR